MRVNKTEVDFIFDTITWSFSSVKTYSDCPKCFYWTYIKPQEKLNNAFAQWGSLGHSLFERYAKGELEMYELGSVYDDEYITSVSLNFPYNRWVDLGEQYYQTGKDYFDNFNGFPSSWEVVGVEQKVNLTIRGLNFVGYIDLIVRDKNTGKYIVVDHKSKSKFKSKQEQKEYARQLYLYSLYIKEQYGEYPSELIFNMFRVGDMVHIPWSQESCDEAVDWFCSTIERIKADLTFEDKIAEEYRIKKKKISEFRHGDFQCNALCNVRKHCERSIEYDEE